MKRDASRQRPRIVAHLGAPDQGRTHRACRRLSDDAASGSCAFLLDADSDCGQFAMPGMLALVPAEPAGDRTPVRQRFTGALLPWDDALSHVSAVASLIESARRLGADVVHVDTTGFVDGPAPRRWLASFLDAIVPDAIELVGDAADTPFERLVGSLSSAPIVRASPPGDIVHKSPVVRSTRRSVRIAKAFEEAATLQLPIDRSTTVGTLLGTGLPLAPGRLAWLADAIGGDVLRGELMADGTACLWVAGGVGTTTLEGAGWMADGIGARRLRWIGPGAWRGRIAAQVFPDNRTPKLVRILGIVSASQALLVEGRNLGAGDASGVLRFGRFRCGEEGTILALATRDAV